MNDEKISSPATVTRYDPPAGIRTWLLHYPVPKAKGRLAKVFVFVFLSIDVVYDVVK
jgi:hypothetical protein